jgi:two-component system cell cycle sensor histidine kinase/response regulator CckA
VFGIVQDMGGFIVVDSHEGAGTTMRVFLPESGAAVGPATTPPGTKRLVGGHETLLLVEDDASLRWLLARWLASSGYRVLEAGGGTEALACAAANDFAIDLLLTDMVMPGMSGRETANALRARLPALRLLFMSGYSPDATLRDEHELGGRLLQKPFTMSELLEHVRRALDGDQADDDAQ